MTGGRAHRKEAVVEWKEKTMSGPFIFIGTYTIHSGKLEETKKHLQEVTDIVETNEPRLIGFDFYLDEEGNKVTCVQVHPDAASMEFHMNLVAEHIRDAFDYLEKTESLEVYGAPSEALAAQLGAFAEPGGLSIMPTHEVGFTRASVR
jgi:quinol monooxygenase YgiN